MFEQLRSTFDELLKSLLDGLEGWQGVQESWTVLADNPDGSTELLNGTRLDIGRSLLLVLRGTEVQESVVHVANAIRDDTEMLSLIEKYYPPQNLKDHVSWEEFVRNIFIGAFLNSYFQKTGSLRYSIEDFDLTFRKLAEDFVAPSYSVKELSPLTNVELATEQFEFSSEMIIRRLSISEKERWANASSNFGGHPLKFNEILRLNCAIEVKYSHDRTDANILLPRQSDEASRLCSAIGLYCDTGVEIAFTALSSDNLCVPIGGMLSNSRNHNIENIVQINEANCLELASLFHKLGTGINSQAVALPVRRWGLAFNRIGHEDRLIDYWIALEALFAPDSQQEIRFRASLRIAGFVGTDSDERRSIYKKMRDSYDLRSKLVHGNLVGVEELKTASDETRGYLRRALLKVIESAAPFDPVSIETGLLEN